MLTMQRLKELLRYNPFDGHFVWIQINPSAKRIKIGDRAGKLLYRGYTMIGIDGRQYLAHRLAWMYMKGDWPKYHIDHINLDKSDNRWENIREATKSQNGANRRSMKNNSTGRKGLQFRDGKWSARITIKGKLLYLGRFDTPEEATEAYRAASIKYFGEFARV